MSFIELNEIQDRAYAIEAQGEGRYGVDAEQQLVMLAAFLNTAQGFLKQLSAAKGLGVPLPNTLPAVVVTYRKVTNAKSRKAGDDYRALPGVRYFTHMGKPVIVRRNKKGAPYFVLADANRSGDGQGFTALKLEGITGFSFKDPQVQAQALRASAAAAA